MLLAEDLLNLPETKKRLNDYGDEILIKNKIKFDIAKIKNYKTNIFYHATGGYGETGLGKGLYLGKDKRALNNFYNTNGGKIEIYKGNPKFLDLSNYGDFDNFESKAKKKYPNSTNNEHLKLLILKMGYDGIRYYDPQATGEEFVLFNTNKVKRLFHEKR
jgi:hypothetical protein